MKITRFIFLSIFILVLPFTGCSKSKQVQKSDEELRAEVLAEMEAEAKKEEALKAQIRAEMEVEQKESRSGDEEALVITFPETRTALSEKQVETIANDLVSTFDMWSGGTLPIGPEEAERFAYSLLFIKGRQHIMDQYIPMPDSLVPEELFGRETVDGKYIEALGEAIFGVDIHPQAQYTYPMFDPGLVDCQLIELNEVDGKYVAALNMLDMIGLPFLKLEIHLSLTDEGYTRVEYVSGMEITGEEAFISGDTVAINAVKPGSMIDGFTVKSIERLSDAQIIIHLEDELVLDGVISIDPMLEQYTFACKVTPFSTKVQINEDVAVELSDWFTIRNENELKQQLGQERLELLSGEMGYQLPVSIKARNYSFGVAYLEHYQDSAADIVEIIEFH